MLNNWKTTITGILTILTAVWTMICNGAADTGSVSAIVAGLGLIFAKDSNVTGGTKQV